MEISEQLPPNELDHPVPSLSDNQSATQSDSLTKMEPESTEPGVNCVVW